MKFLIRVVLGLTALAVLGAVGLFAMIQSRWDRRFEIPEPAVTASHDPAMIARGAYLVFGPAHCASCHSPPDAQAAIARGEEPPLSGGRLWDLPLGKIRASNLTPDAKTGIGALRDGQLARTLRNNLRHDGRALFPMKTYENLAEDDLLAILSYLRAQAPVRHAVPQIELTLPGKALYALVNDPRQPRATPPARAPAEAVTIERGRYLAEDVAMCEGCHTAREMKSGEFVGEPHAGGLAMDVEGAPGKVIITPNLTPDPETGRMSGWDEATFVARFDQGAAIEGSPMPWEAYARLTPTDRKALWAYYGSLAPVVRDTGPAKQVRAPGE